MLLFVASNSHAFAPGLANKTTNIGDTSKIILIEEFNIYKRSIYFNTYFELFNNNWNVGIQSTNIRAFGSNTQSFNNDTYINGSYKFNLSNEYNIETGGQVGTNFDNNPHKFHDYQYIDLSRTLYDKITIYGGGYFVNDSLAQIHQPWNWQAGSKIKMFNIILTIDYLSGKNNLSGSTINLFYKLNEHLRPYVGFQSQYPMFSSGEYVGNIGFTLKLN